MFGRDLYHLRFVSSQNDCGKSFYGLHYCGSDRASRSASPSVRPSARRARAAADRQTLSKFGLINFAREERESRRRRRRSRRRKQARQNTEEEEESDRDSHRIAEDGKCFLKGNIRQSVTLSRETMGLWFVPPLIRHP